MGAKTRRINLADSQLGYVIDILEMEQEFLEQSIQQQPKEEWFIDYENSLAKLLRIIQKFKDLKDNNN